MVFYDEQNRMLEGAVSNLFIKKNGAWFTPPLEAGILNGCYRQYFIQKNHVEEKEILLDDLDSADQIILCNSVRKEVTVSHYFTLA